MAGLIGALRVTLSADTAAFTSGMSKAQRQAATSGSAIQRSLGGIKAAFAGLAAGVSLGMFAHYGKQALDYAASLTETARSAGLTVEQLQILSRMALQNGASVDQLTTATARLNAKLGEAKAGSASAIKFFAQLGIPQEQLASFDRAGDILPTVMQGIKGLKDETLQAAAAKIGFGKAFAPLLPMLVQGADGYNEAADAAQRAGLLTAEQAARADEANDTLALLATTLQTKLAIALTDNIGPIESVIQGLADLIDMAGKAMSWLGRLQAKYDHFMGSQKVIRGLTQGVREEGVQQMQAAQARLNGYDKEDRLRLGREWSPGAFRLRGSTTAATTPRLDLTAPGRSGGKKKGGKSAEQAEKERIRAIEEAAENQRRFMDEEGRANADVVRATAELAGNREARLDAELHQIDTEREINARKINADKDLDAAQRARLLYLNEENADTQKALAVERDFRERQEESLQLAEARADLGIQILENESSAATTAKEQREAELRLLDATIEMERARLEGIKAMHKSTDIEYQIADIQLQGLEAKKAGAAAGIRRDKASPMERYRDRLDKTSEEINEEIEQYTVDRLEQLEESIAAGIANKIGVKDPFLQSIIELFIQQVLIRPLMEAFSAQSGGGGIFGSIFSGAKTIFGGGGFGGGATGGGIFGANPTGGAIGMAHGGAFTIAGRGGIDRNLLSINGSPVARVSKGERVSVSPDNDNHSRQVVRVILDHSPALVARVVEGDRQAATTGSSGALSVLSRRQNRAIP